MTRAVVMPPGLQRERCGAGNLPARRGCNRLGARQSKAPGGSARRGPSESCGLAKDLDFGNGYDKTCIEIRHATQRAHDFLFQIPRQYEYVVGLGAWQLVWAQYRDMSAGGELALLIW